MSLRAIRMAEPGGPEVLQPVEIPPPSPGVGELLVRVVAAGVNYIDTYHRTGLYPLPLPCVPGLEGAGEVIAAGPGTSVPVGARVAWASGLGSYAEQVVVPESKAVLVPDGVPTDVAAAVMLQGMTAAYLRGLLRDRVERGTAVVLAAAGGTGLLLTQLLVEAGHTVIGVASPGKEALVREAGAAHVVPYEGFAAAVRSATGGRGADIVYDSVGASTWRESLAALALRGTLVLFGQSSGVVPPIDPAELAKGSLSLTRPALGHFTSTRQELVALAELVLGAVARGRLTVRIAHRVPLAEAARAHRILEGRGSLGKILLVP